MATVLNMWPDTKGVFMKKSLAHTVWECKYHIVWVPKNRRKIIYGKLRKDIGAILRRLCPDPSEWVHSRYLI